MKITIPITLIILFFLSCTQDKSYESQLDNFAINEGDFYTLKSKIESLTHDNNIIAITTDGTKFGLISVSIGTYDSLNNRMRFPDHVFENIDVSTSQVDEILQITDWRKSDLITVIEDLNNLNCTGFVSTNEYDSLSGFKFNYGVGQTGQSYDYILFKSKAIPQIKKYYFRKTGISFYNDTVILKTTY